MGQKVNPHGLRVGVIKSWDTQWFAEKKNFSDNLVEDYNIRKFLKKTYYTSSISKIIISRTADKVIIDIYTSKPGVLIGRAGAGVEQMKKEVEKLVKKANVSINIIVHLRQLPPFWQGFRPCKPKL